MTTEYKINLCYADLSLFGKEIIYMGKQWIFFQNIERENMFLFIIKVIPADVKP